MNLWEELTELEQSVVSDEWAWIAGVEPAVNALAEVAIEIFAVPATEPREYRTIVAAACLKRALHDLRTFWICLKAGYPVSAASIAGSIWEHAHLAACVAHDAAYAESLSRTNENDRRYGPSAIAKRIAEIETGKGDEDDQLAAERIYASYKWLCQIKHPTLHSIATLDSSTGQDALIVGIFPHESNVDTSKIILLISLMAIDESIRLIARSTVLDRSSIHFKASERKLRSAIELYEQELRIMPGATLPLTLRHTKLGERLAASGSKS